MAAIKTNIAILGAGPCGLYAARILSKKGYQVIVIDQGERPGGLATSYHYGNNWYDMGVHMLHAFDNEIFNDIKDLMGSERIEVDLNAKIKWANAFYRYPLQFIDILKGIPILKLIKQVFFLFWTQFYFYLFPRTAQNAEEALIQLYGKPLYEFFFKDFTHRYWGIHPKELSATFITTKMPKLTAVDVFKKALSMMGIKSKTQSVESALTKEILHYSRQGAGKMPGSIARAIMNADGKMIQNATVKKLNLKDNLVKSVVYEKDNVSHEVLCDACISTIGIHALVRALQPTCPEPILNAVNHLRFKSIVIYGLLVRKEKCLDALYVYYRNNIYHRIGEPKNAGMIIDPPDHTVLIIEMTCEKNDARWRGDESVRSQLYEELSKEGICQPEEIVELYVSPYENGYPIYSLGFEPHLEAVKKYLKNFSNLISTGRQGAFMFPHMHKAMRMGWEAAEEMMGRISVRNLHITEEENAHIS